MKKYDESSIQHFEGLQAIRKRPTMYAGSINNNGVFVMFREAADNSFDEAKIGECDELFILIDEKEKTFTITDNGRGIPLGKLKELVSNIHAGGKFDSDAYTFSSGLNGVGLKVINACSESFKVKVKRECKEAIIEYDKGILTKDFTVLRKVKKNDTGTTVIFKPDMEVMEEYNLELERYMQFCEMSSYLIPNLKIQYNVKKKNGKMISKEFLSKKGLEDLIYNIEKKPLFKPAKFTKELEINEEIEDDKTKFTKKVKMNIEVFLTYTSKKDEQILSFVNGVQTSNGGTHESGCKAGLTQVIKKYIDTNNIKTKKEEKLEITGNDVREGLLMLINVKHSDPKYDSQTKDQITNTDLLSLGRTLFNEQMENWLAQNQQIAKALCRQIIVNAKGREASDNIKKNSKKDSIFGSLSAISKFSDCKSKDKTKRRLWIVEGDSAGGSAIEGRDPEYDAIYKLKGKPCNGYEASLNKILSTAELRDLITILGCGIGKDFDASKCNFDKIIFMTDADIDGYDIKALLDGFFFKHLRPLIENGHVYHALPPLYGFKEKGGEMKYLKDKNSFIKFLTKRCGKDFILVTKNKEEKKKIKLEKVIEKMNIYNLYSDDIKAYITNSNLLEELLIVFSKSDKLKTWADKKGLLFKDNTISGNYENDIIFIDIDCVKEKLKKLKSIYKELNIKKLYIKRDKKLIKTNLSEVYSLIKKEEPKGLQRFKGLGEMNSDQLYETTMNIDNPEASLKRIIISDIEKAINEVDVQLGKDADKRKDSMANFDIDPLELDR